MGDRINNFSRSGKTSALYISQACPDATRRLVCFHYAGGNSNAFRSWASLLPSSIELVLVELPGRNRRMAEPLLYSMDDIVDALVVDVISILDKPCIFFGHSLGGLVAFELARKLQNEQQPLPSKLVLSAIKAPSLLSNRTRWTDQEEKLILLLREFGGVPPQLLRDYDVLNYFLPIIRADLCVYEKYSYRASTPLHLDMIALGGNDDPHVSVYDLAAWEVFTSASFKLQVFDGGHFYLNHHVREIIELMLD